MRVKLKAKAVATPADSNVIGKKLLLSTGFCCLHTISLSFRKKLAKLIRPTNRADRPTCTPWPQLNPAHCTPGSSVWGGRGTSSERIAASSTSSCETLHVAKGSHGCRVPGWLRFSSTVSRLFILSIHDFECNGHHEYFMHGVTFSFSDRCKKETALFFDVSRVGSAFHFV